MANRDPQLARSLRAPELFALGFGGIVGAGWVVAIGGWLEQAGPVGAVIAFAAGGFVMALVGACYAEIATIIPASGGEVVYAHEVFGAGASFAVGWCLTLAYIATTVFEALSVAWIVDALFPLSLGPTLYTIRGQPIQVGTLLLGIGGMTLISILNFRGVRLAAAAQDFFTYAKIAIATVFIMAGLVWGKPHNLQPLFVGGSSSATWLGVGAVLTTSAFWYGGFNTIAQVMGERAPRSPLSSAGRMTVASIAAAAAFYCLVILSVSAVVPWRQLVTADLPVARAFESAFRSAFFAKLVLVAALLGILTVWNGVALAASRILFAMGRARLLPKTLGAVHPVHGSPGTAIVVSGIVSIAGITLGRGAIGTVVNVASTCFALGYVLVCFALLRLRNRQPHRRAAYRVPGGSATIVLATATAGAILVLSIQGPVLAPHQGLPPEWIVFGLWVAAGIVVWFASSASRRTVTDAQRRILLVGNELEMTTHNG